MTGGVPDRDIVVQVARTALRTKLHTQLADQARGTRRRTPSLPADASFALCAVQLTDIVVDAVALVHRPDVPIDLHMVEVRLVLGAAPVAPQRP